MPPPMTSSRFGTPLQLQRAGRVDHPRVVGDERQLHRLRARGDDALVEADGLRPVRALDPDRVRPGEGADALDHRHLARPWRARKPAGQLLDDALLPAAQPSTSTSGLANFTPKWPISSASEMTLAACSSAFDGMQPTLRQTPPSVGSRSISTTFLPEIGGAERRGVAAGTRAEHHQPRHGCRRLRRGARRGAGAGCGAARRGGRRARRLRPPASG